MRPADSNYKPKERKVESEPVLSEAEQRELERKEKIH